MGHGRYTKKKLLQYIGIVGVFFSLSGFVPTIMLAILKAADTGDNFWIIIASAAAVFIVVQIIQDGYLVPRIRCAQPSEMLS